MLGGCSLFFIFAHIGEVGNREPGHPLLNGFTCLTPMSCAFWGPCVEWGMSLGADGGHQAPVCASGGTKALGRGQPHVPWQGRSCGSARTSPSGAAPGGGTGISNTLGNNCTILSGINPVLWIWPGLSLCSVGSALAEMFTGHEMLFSAWKSWKRPWDRWSLPPLCVGGFVSSLCGRGCGFPAFPH